MTNSAIIERLELEANRHAKAHADEVAAFHRRERLRRMEVLLRDVRDEADVRGDLARLAGLGVSLDVVDDGHVVFNQAGHAFDLVARGDLSVMAGGVVVYPNRDCPVLDQRCYDEIMRLVFAWAGRRREHDARCCFVVGGCLRGHDENQVRSEVVGLRQQGPPNPTYE